MDSTDEKLLKQPNEELLSAPVSERDAIQWYCVYTRPRHEKAVAMKCDRLDINFYLPLRRVTHHYKSGKKRYWLPLFRGYVFGLSAPDKRIELSREERVLSVLEVSDQQTFIDELLQIYRGLQVSCELQPVPYLARGRHVEIVRGPFKGIRGVVEEVKSRFRVMLTATMMNSSVPLEVDAGDVEPIDAG